MKLENLSILACPICRAQLTLDGPESDPLEKGGLCCEGCGKYFPICDGIPRFITRSELTGFNRRFSNLYDWFSWGYAGFVRAAFVLIGVKEETGRREITDRLDPQGGRMLEISIGTGSNLPAFVNRPDVGEVTGLDISARQLQRCQRLIQKNGWDVDLMQANAEQLPYRDEVFASILHVGGINFFDNKAAAIQEMIRVAKPGARILISDETEKGARGYENTIPGFKKSFHHQREAVLPPIDLIPKEMGDIHLRIILKGWFYCIEFRKP